MPLPRRSAAVCILLLTSLACASVPSRSIPGQGSPEAPPTSGPSTPSGEPAAPPADRENAGGAKTAGAEVQKVIDAMEDLYNSGLDAHKAGRYAEARDYFDQAIEAALSANVDIDSEPALRKSYEETLANIDALEGDLFQDQGKVEPGEESPKEELKDINSYLTPEEAEKERAKVESVSHSIQYDIPVVLTGPVLTFIEAFQTHLRGPFEAGLRRSGKYLDMIKTIFTQEGLPTDLAYMAHQESAFKTSAYSRAKAKGLWQFIGPTARKYGLKRDDWVDERSDPEKATRAAAAYLKDLYAMFGDWHLAMAAYNAGEGKVRRAMTRTGARDFWSLAQHRRALRQETRNYVPAILASVVVDRAPEEYGFSVDLEDPLVYDQVTIVSATDLKVVADCADTTLETIRALNPELRTMATPPYAEGYSLKLPPGSGATFVEKLAAVPREERLRWTQHRVRRGETLAVIARRYRVSAGAILSANSMRSAHRLRVGQALVIPMSGAVPPRVSRAALDEEAPSYEKGEKVIHRVRRGDTLQRIAARYRTNIASLREWNGVPDSSIRPGQRLTVYYATRIATPREPFRAPEMAAGAEGEYQVRSGDTLYSIAQRFGMTLAQLRTVNHLGRKSVIRPGDRLRVSVPQSPDAPASSGGGARPSPTSVIRYRIRPGDTLERIALRHRVPLSDLMRWNRLDSPDDIAAGDVLNIHID